MDINWQGSVQINAPVEQVYRYLADFPRHCEWAQTLERMEQIRAGDSTGIGARYLTFERQAMQADRKPYERLTRGVADPRSILSGASSSGFAARTRARKEILGRRSLPKPLDQGF